MAALLSIAEIIEVGDVSIYLSSNDNSRGAMFGKRLSSPISPVMIAMVTDAIRWELEGDSTDDTLRGTANYCLWCYGKYGQQGQYIISGSGGGSVSPASTSRPLPLDFLVSASSVIATGGSGLTIPSYVGWNLDFFRNNIPQNTTDLGDGTSYYNWNRDTGTFSCSPVAGAGELFRLSPT